MYNPIIQLVGLSHAKLLWVKTFVSILQKPYKMQSGIYLFPGFACSWLVQAGGGGEGPQQRYENGGMEG
jgi:hypothetical protein